jgi:hypothetical protein
MDGIMVIEKIKKYLAVFLLCFVSMGSTGTYFVSASGDNSNPGTLGSPWQGIQFAVDKAQGGDTVFVRGGTYNELIIFHKSGNAVKGYIVLRNYRNENAVIDGSGLAEKNGDRPALIEIVDKGFIRVDGFEMRNLITDNPRIFPIGIWITGAAHHIDILNNNVHHIQNPTKRGGHGIAVYGTDANAPIHDILIEGNEVSFGQFGSSESVVINGNVENWIVRNNVVHDNNNIAFDFIGHERKCLVPELDQARNGLVVGNIAYNIDSRGNPAYGNSACADGFYVDGGRDIIMERNEVYNCNIGIELASEHGNKKTSSIILRNNYIHDNPIIGLAIGGYDAKRGITNDCQILNNTFYNNNTEKSDYGSEILLQYYCKDNTFKNNIIYSGEDVAFIKHQSGTGSENQFDYNLYFTKGKPLWMWANDTFESLDLFRNATNEEVHTLFTDPLFTASGSMPAIQSSSPARDKGDSDIKAACGAEDYFGNKRVVNDVIDIGAAEYQD